jgi:hypothetical protein
MQANASELRCKIVRGHADIVAQAIEG